MLVIQLSVRQDFMYLERVCPKKNHHQKYLKTLYNVIGENWSNSNRAKNVN